MTEAGTESMAPLGYSTGRAMVSPFRSSERQQGQGGSVANARSGKRVREIPQPGLKRTAWGVGCGEVLGRWKWARRRGRCRVAAAWD